MSFSWQMRSVASPPAPAAPVGGAARARGSRADAGKRSRAAGRALARRLPRGELAAVMALAAVLNLWDLSRNGWANEYYAAAVRSMSASWHDFLFASLDRSGVMTVDKPPLALWVQALSVRVFGFHSLSILVPQALMGVASVALLYDLVRRRFGRVGGFVAALALALTPVTVAISRHNNPDSLLVLCCVAALWCAVRALEDPRTRWLVACGVMVGLGFETKMLVAMVVVPGVALAWLWLAPAARGRWHALRQLLAGAGAMLAVGGAWPLLVELTPGSDRPWVSGTADNRILSLIFEYNGLGRVDGQSGGPGGTASNMFGGATGPLRLLNAALGGQAGWLLGFALVSGLAILVYSRLRRTDARSGWLLMVGGAFAVTAVLFSFASGIFHPYYVSLLAPFAAALVGAGAAQLISDGVNVRIVGPLAVLAGVGAELLVRGNYEGQLPWLAPVLIAVGAPAALALLATSSRTVRVAATGAALAALLAAPAVWAFDTLGHATSGTFPAGGPANAENGGFGGPGFGARGRGFVGPRGGFVGPVGGGGFPGAGNGGATGGAGSGGAGSGGGAPGGASSTAGRGVSVPRLFGSGSSAASGGVASGGAALGGVATGGAGSGGGGSGGVAGVRSLRGRGGFSGGGLPSGGGGGFGSNVSASVLRYVAAHGGGTIAVSSQSSAASAIVAEDANVAGIGGFSGRESEVNASWLAMEVREHKIRWVLDEEGGSAGTEGRGGFAPAGGSGGGPQRETRVGAKKAMAAVARACKAVSVTSSEAGGSAGGTGASAGGTLYDCEGRAAELASVGG
jgi:4-amino-4-deoxy-L-arabinose transferase-like glycosyltransferase